MVILENLELLKKKMAGGDENVLEQLDAWEKEIKTQSRLQELGKMDVVKEIVKQLKEQIKNINDRLRDDKEVNRDELFIQRDCWHWLINLFTSADDLLLQINEDIENNLKE